MEQEDEKMIMKAIREVGVNVDKEELIKALQYDRNQYTKGYEDGKNDVLDKITEIIEPLRHLSIDQMSDIEWQILRVIDKYKAESEG